MVPFRGTLRWTHGVHRRRKRAIRLSSKSKDKNKDENVQETIIKYIIDKLVPIIKIDKIVKFINFVLRTTSGRVVDHLMEKHYNYDYIIEKTNIYDIITSANVGGQINFIENICRLSLSKEKHDILFMISELKDMKSIINNNSEDECIKFILFMGEYNINFTQMNEAIKTSIEKGFFKLLIYMVVSPHILIDYGINNHTKTKCVGKTVSDAVYITFVEERDIMTEYDLINHYVATCINYSASEELCISFIRWICAGDLENINMSKVMIKTVVKGYLNLMKYLYRGDIDKKLLGDLLIKACYNNRFEMVKYLIDIGADVNYINKNENGSVDTDIFYESVARVIATECKNIEMMKYIIDKGINIKDLFIFLYDHNDKLSRLSREIFVETVKYIYNKGLMNINSIETYTIFNDMCSSGIHELIEYFLNEGIQMKELINKSLNNAYESNNKKIIELIVSNEKNNKFINNPIKCFVKLCRDGCTKIVKILTAYVDLDKCGGSTLLRACNEGYLEIVVHLVESGVNFEKYGNRALRLSAIYGFIDIVKYLVEKGADPKVINAKYYDKEVDTYLKEIGVHIEFDRTRREIIIHDDYEGEENMDDDYYSDNDLDND